MRGALGIGAFAVADAGRSRARAATQPEQRAARVPLVDVAVAIVRDAAGRVLVAERTPRQIAAGFWELPGGKIDAGEVPAHAAARELAEETGIAAHDVRPAIVYEHAFVTKRVRLHCYTVDTWSGAPHGREGQRVAWIDPAAPHVAPLLPSNERVLAALSLPRTYLLTPGCDTRCAADFAAELPRFLRAGACAIGVREPELPPDQRVAFGRRIVAIARHHGARVLLAGSALEARRAGAAGVHSDAAAVRRLTTRPACAFWIAACAQAEDARSALALGADALLLDAEPERPVPGGARFERADVIAPVPVYVRAGQPAPSPLAAIFAQAAHG